MGGIVCADNCSGEVRGGYIIIKVLLVYCGFRGLVIDFVLILLREMPDLMVF